MTEPTYCNYCGRKLVLRFRKDYSSSGFWLECPRVSMPFGMFGANFHFKEKLYGSHPDLDRFDQHTGKAKHE